MFRRIRTEIHHHLSLLRIGFRVSASTRKPWQTTITAYTLEHRAVSSHSERKRRTANETYEASAHAHIAAQ